MGLTQGQVLALVASVARAELRSTAFGMVNLVIGAASISYERGRAVPEASLALKGALTGNHGGF